MCRTGVCSMYTLYSVSVFVFLVVYSLCKERFFIHAVIACFLAGVFHSAGAIEFLVDTSAVWLGHEGLVWSTGTRRSMLGMSSLVAPRSCPVRSCEL